VVMTTTMSANSPSTR